MNKRFENNFPLCMQYDIKNGINECRTFGGKCSDHSVEECKYKNLNRGFGNFTLDNFKIEVIQQAVSMIFGISANDLFKTTNWSFAFNFKNYKLTLKIDKGWDEKQ